MSYTAEEADAANNHGQKEHHTMTRKTTPGNRRNTATKSMQRNAHPDVQYTDDQRDAATVAMLDDPAAYADSLSKQAAASSMAPTGLDHYTTDQYLQDANVVDAFARYLADMEATPLHTLETFTAETQQPARVALDLWIARLVPQIHDGVKTRTIDARTGEVREPKTFTRRWNTRDDMTGTLAVGDATYVLADDTKTDDTGTPYVWFIKIPHHETMWYEPRPGLRVPYLGQFVDPRRADEPGAGNQATSIGAAIILCKFTHWQAAAMARHMTEVRRAAWRMENTERNADTTEDEQPKALSQRNAAADAAARAFDL